MKKRMFLLPILLLISISTNVSATDVSGDVWGEWTSAGNPYNVLDDLRVPPGSALVIGPGCYVEFQGYYQFLVDTSAVLRALGSEPDSVYFTASDTTAGWKGIIFDHSDSNSALSYCMFEYVKGPSHQKVVSGISSDLHIEHCLFASNQVLNVIILDGRYGGGTVNDNLFTLNVAEEIIAHYGDLPASIFSNIFEYNNSGMLIFQFSNEMLVQENVFRYNIGLVMYSRWSSTDFIRNMAHNNFSDILPSVFFGMDADYLIENNTVCNNISTSPFFPLAYFETEHVAFPAYMINNIFWGNVYEGDSVFQTNQTSLAVTYCDVQGGWPGGNIDADPMFVDTANGDYHLTAGSPCIDTGDPASPLDPDSTRTDMGALYFDQTTGIIKPPLLPREIALHQNYPNPFNTGTKISFTIFSQSEVTINIFDILGRRVNTLLDRQLQAGEYSITWDGRSDSGERMSSGIYFYNLKTGRFEDSKKMVILK